MYHLVPAICNPIIYGLRTTEIRTQIVNLFKFNKVNNSLSNAVHVKHL